MSSEFTVFSGGSVGRDDEEEETKHQSHSGVSDVVLVTEEDENRRNWSTRTTFVAKVEPADVSWSNYIRLL